LEREGHVTDKEYHPSGKLIVERITILVPFECFRHSYSIVLASAQVSQNAILKWTFRQIVVKSMFVTSDDLKRKTLVTPLKVIGLYVR
jgi:hypothetical protein